MILFKLEVILKIIGHRVGFVALVLYKRFRSDPSMGNKIQQITEI